MQNCKMEVNLGVDPIIFYCTNCPQENAFQPLNGHIQHRGVLIYIYMPLTFDTFLDLLTNIAATMQPSPYATTDIFTLKLCNNGNH